MKPRRRRRLSTGHPFNYATVTEQSEDNKQYYDIVINAVNLKGLNETNLNAKIYLELYYGEGTQDGYQCLAAEEE